MTEERKEKLKENFDRVRAEIEKRNPDAILLAATKTVSAEDINYAIDHLGLRYIGENRVPELLEKYDAIHKTAPDGTPVEIHFIGHLQTNKVKDIIGEVEMIESVHSVKLAAEINKLCEKHGKVMDILCEVNVGNEESKSGFATDEIFEKVVEISKMPNVRVKGLMTIPPICETVEESAEYFAILRKLFIDIKAKKVDNVDMVYLSMGMSGDYEQAIEYGANIVRIGTSLFGQRNYAVNK